MSDRPKASRMEKQVRNLGRGLFWLSLILLVVCVSMTGVYGYSLGTDTLNGLLLGFGFGAADIAGGLSASFSGACYALKNKKAGTLAFFAAFACFVFSFYGVTGFQSINREAQAQTRERAAKISDETMGWSKQIAITSATAAAAKATGKSQAELLAGGIHAVGEQADKQIKLVLSGGLPVADANSSTMSRVFRIDPASARSYAISGGSALLLAIQYFCLWAYGVARHSLEPAVSAQNAVTAWQFVGDKTTNSTNQTALSEDVARQVLNSLMFDGFSLDRHGAYSFLARRFGWTPHKTRRWLERQSDLAIKAKRHHRKSVQSGDNHAPTLNGRAHAV